MDPDSHLHVLRRQLLLDRDRGLHGGERTREHAHAPVAQPLHNRPRRTSHGASRARSCTEVAPLESPTCSSACINAGLTDRVREHHRYQATVEPITHGGDDNAVRLRPRGGIAGRVRLPGFGVLVAEPESRSPSGSWDRTASGVAGSCPRRSVASSETGIVVGRSPLLRTVACAVGNTTYVNRR